MFAPTSKHQLHTSAVSGSQLIAKHSTRSVHHKAAELNTQKHQLTSDVEMYNLRLVADYIQITPDSLNCHRIETRVADLTTVEACFNE